MITLKCLRSYTTSKTKRKSGSFNKEVVMSQAPTGGGPFLKATDLTPNQTIRVKIITEADWIDSSFNNPDGSKQQQYVCEVEHEGEKKRLKLTIASCQTIVPVYGKDSVAWVGKEIGLEPIKVIVGGNVKQSILATPIDATPEQKEEAASAAGAVAWDE
jgi:hypothetical protein